MRIQDPTNGFTMILSDLDLHYPMPHLSMFKSSFEETYGCADETRTWHGTIEGCVVDIELFEMPLSLSWGAKVNVQSNATGRTIRFSVFPKWLHVEDVYITVCKKLDKKLAVLAHRENR